MSDQQQLLPLTYSVIQDILGALVFTNPVYDLEYCCVSAGCLRQIGSVALQFSLNTPGNKQQQWHTAGVNILLWNAFVIFVCKMYRYRVDSNVTFGVITK